MCADFQPTTKPSSRSETPVERSVELQLPKIPRRTETLSEQASKDGSGGYELGVPVKPEDSKSLKNNLQPFNSNEQLEKLFQELLNDKKPQTPEERKKHETEQAEQELFSKGYKKV